MVSTLLRNNALVDQICLKKWTAMHEAAKVGCSDIMMLLIRNGANIMQTNGHGVSPLGVAAEYGHAEVLEILIHKGNHLITRLILRCLPFMASSKILCSLIQKHINVSLQLLTSTFHLLCV